ncbi:MAG: glycosyltransferase family 39 protein [Chloroflexia bacterium]
MSEQAQHLSRRDWLSLGLVLVVALALRLALWGILPRNSLVSDEPEYLAAAGELARGRGFSFYTEWPWLRPPLYLLFLAPFIRLFGLTCLPIRAAQVLLSLSIPALVYLLARTSFGRRSALPAGLLAALYFPLAALPHLILAENLFLPLLLASCYGLVRFSSGRSRPGEAAVSGLLLGLATLTRGLTLGFLPLAVLWVAVVSWRRRPRERPFRALLPALLLAGASLLVILPWSGYISWRYGRPILVDTTGGYNFWLGTQGGQFRDTLQVQRELLALPDPAARQEEAYRRGWESLAADPGGFLRNRLTELGQLLRINYGADERLTDGFARGELSRPHLLSLLILEDTFYVLLVPLALLGLFRQGKEAGRGLYLLWMGYNLLLGLAFFSISRFRLPFLPFLCLYAAGLLNSRTAKGFSKVRLAAAGLLLLAFWAVVLPSYLGPYPSSWAATLLGLRARGVAEGLARAEAALAAGDRDGAWQELRPALLARPLGDVPLDTALVVLAEWQRAGGDAEGALATLNGLEWYPARLLRGDILRALGKWEAARSEFSARELKVRNPTGWAWSHLRPPAGRELDLGGGLDWGLVDGFYSPEQEGSITYRWSAGEARLRFPQAGTGRPCLLRLRLRAWRPAGEPRPQVILLLEEREAARFGAPDAWEELAFPLPAVPAGADVVLTLRSDTFFPGPRDLLETGQLRLLGVMVDRAWLEEK